MRRRKEKSSAKIFAFRMRSTTASTTSFPLSFGTIVLSSACDMGSSKSKIVMAKSVLRRWCPSSVMMTGRHSLVSISGVLSQWALYAAECRLIQQKCTIVVLSQLGILKAGMAHVKTMHFRPQPLGRQYSKCLPSGLVVDAQNVWTADEWISLESVPTILFLRIRWRRVPVKWNVNECNK